MTAPLPFHLKYRPRNFADVIGHEDVVTRLKGIVKGIQAGTASKNAILLVGPTSAGKTTLARAFAAELNGIANIESHPDYKEYNASEAKTMDDVREWVKNSRFQPRTKKRIIFIDEAQGLLSNGQAAAAFLKPLEEPASNTIWILGSMDPAKFASDKNGKAIAGRCAQFSLEPHTEKDLYKHALRIAKAESMKYVLAEDKSILKAVVAASGGTMRNIGNLVESLRDYYEGIEGKKPKLLDKAAIKAVLQTADTLDDATAAKVLNAVYNRNFTNVQKNLLNVNDAFAFINKLLWANSYLLNTVVLDGVRHHKVYPSAAAKQLQASMEKLPALRILAAVHECLVNVKGSAATFAVPEIDLLGARLYRVIKDLAPPKGE